MITRGVLLPKNVRSKFIPLNNDLRKLEAFLPSLNKDWRSNQRIKSKPFQAETMDAIKTFIGRGWNVVGGYEKRGKNRKIQNHHIKMVHPDLAIKNNKGKNEACALLNISNSCNGSSPLDFNIGMYRQVCSNGMVAHTKYSQGKINHTEKDLNDFNQIICNFEGKTQLVIDEFGKLKEKELSPQQMVEMAASAAELRFGENHDINIDQLLNSIREEDEGNDVWSVYNRIQENITQPGMIVDNTGKLIGGITDVSQDINLNKQLFNLAHAYA